MTKTSFGNAKPLRSLLLYRYYNNLQCNSGKAQQAYATMTTLSSRKRYDTTEEQKFHLLVPKSGGKLRRISPTKLMAEGLYHHYGHDRPSDTWAVIKHTTPRSTCVGEPKTNSESTTQQGGKKFTDKRPLQNAIEWHWSITCWYTLVRVMRQPIKVPYDEERFTP